MIGEFGTSSGGWNRDADPYLRGLRQGVWAGALGGSVGTSMSWGWENIHDENVYPLYAALGDVLNRTGWGIGEWAPIQFADHGPAPGTVGALVPGGVPFNATLALAADWGGMTSGAFAVASEAVAGNSAEFLNAFVQGYWHSDLKTPFQLSAWLTNNAKLVLHVNSVSGAANLTVNVDGATLFTTNLPNIDGTHVINGEYDMDLVVDLPPGKRLIEVTNSGGDWVFLDWARLEGVLPAEYPGGWQPVPEALGLAGPHESLLYVTAPNTSFPAQATSPVLPLQQGAVVLLTNWPGGDWRAEWYEPTNGAYRGLTAAQTTNGLLAVPLPDFREDLAGILYRPPSLSHPRLTPPGTVRFQLLSETGGRYALLRSRNLQDWTQLGAVTNRTGADEFTDSAPAVAGRYYKVVGTR
jgi:hypothetical protein